MTDFNGKFFQEFSFPEKEVSRFLENANRDLKIARMDKFAEVRFSYAYQALIKAGIALIAVHKKKLRSMPGHHLKVLEKMSELLKDPGVFVMGNAMRMKRNTDLYSGGEFISEKEAEDYCVFVAGVLAKVSTLIKSHD